MVNVNPKMIIFQDEKNKIDGEYSSEFNCFNINDVVLEIKGTDTCDIEVQVAVNTTSELEWTTIALINASDYSVSSKAEAKGIYFASLAGCQKVRLKVNNLSEDTIITMMEVY